MVYLWIKILDFVFDDAFNVRLKIGYWLKHCRWISCRHQNAHVTLFIWRKKQFRFFFQEYILDFKEFMLFMRAFLTNFPFLFLASVDSAIPWNEDYNYNDQFGVNNYHSGYYNRFQARNFENYYPQNNYFERPYQKCQCMRVKYCQPIMRILANAPKPLSPNLIANVRGKSCGYSGRDPLVCCPLEQRSRRNSFEFDYNHGYYPTTTTEKPWVWDVEPKRDDRRSYDNRPNSLNDRFNYDWEYYNFKHFMPNFGFNLHPPHHQGDRGPVPPKNLDKKFFFFDFEDPRTFQNCPPSISDEFEMPDDLKHVRPVKNFHPIRVPMDASNPNIVTEIRPSTTVRDRPLIFSTGIPPATTQPTPVNPNALPADKLALINPPSCGISINNRIIGGEDAGPGQFPWWIY